MRIYLNVSDLDAYCSLASLALDFPGHRMLSELFQFLYHQRGIQSFLTLNYSILRIWLVSGQFSVPVTGIRRKSLLLRRGVKVEQVGDLNSQFMISFYRLWGGTAIPGFAASIQVIKLGLVLVIISIA